ncbi:MAG: ABC transporter permease subunit [Rhodospirillales bacterium]|nr:ABC transporter permease subunit [Rhodospirillales bacterium]
MKTNGLVARIQGKPDRWKERWGQRLVAAVPMGWLLVFFLAPFLFVLKIAFSESRLGIPPYQPLLEWVDGAVLQLQFNLANFGFFLEDPLYAAAYLSSLKMAAVSTLICLMIGYPMAYSITKVRQPWRNVLLMLVILPFWTSFLIRVYAWIGILKNEGLLNNFLMWVGVIDQPLPLLHSPFAVYVGIVYSYLPFMILPLYATLERMDLTLREAAQDLGCRPWEVMLKITLPLSLPGIIAGSMLVFIPAAGEFVIPDLLGGSNVLMIGKVLWNEFFLNRDWPLASAVAVVMLVLLLVPFMLFQHYQARQDEAEAR